MSNIYEAIKLLDSKEERTALRVLFTKDPEIEARAELVLPTCEDNEEIVNYFKELLKPGMFFHSRDIFANNTEYLFLCFSFLLLIVKPAQKTHSRYRRATRCW